MESTIGLYKSELIDFEAGTWTGCGEVERATADWVRWYNHERLHSSLGHIPPIEHQTNYQRENYAGRINAVAENFFSHLKTEMYHHDDFKNHLTAKTAVMEYIEGWYNRRRPHSNN